MSVAVAEEVSLTLGSAQFIHESEREQLLTLAEREELVAVRTGDPGPAQRGNLGLWLEESIDTTLERLGAAPPGIAASTNLDASLSDQLYRARLVGRRGLLLSIPSLQGIANAAGVLDADDSRILRWWSLAVADRPVQVLLDASNRSLGAYGAPCRLVDVLDQPSANRRNEPESVPDVAPAVAGSVLAMELSHTAYETRRDELAPSDLEVNPKHPDQSPEPSFSSHWPEWVTALEAARGPKPLSVIERLFVSSYVPLGQAILSGLEDSRARSVLEAWSKNFERSYTDAFDALRHRGKRPTMVLDVPDIAARIARLHGARSVQLVVVDGMRFDLGLRVEARLQELLAGRAALAERLLLWAALPSNTQTQLELLGRGPAGLKDFEPRAADQTDGSVVVAHGRNATTLRRVKAGNRELYKLDVVQARLEGPGAPLNERLDEIADEASAALAQFLGKLPPRTLAFVFGDHGFHLDPFDGGTSAERHGGATPEEVLVPGFAWLVGDVH